MSRPPILVGTGLTRHLGGRRVVDGVSLALRGGEWAAVVGPNGAGKSTLLRLLAGIEPVDGGQVEIDGRDRNAMTRRERARSVAWLTQAGEPDGDIAVRDVVALARLPHHGLLGAPGAEDLAAIDAAMAEAECTGLATRRLGELSGGERQRVLLARALAVGSPVLLLDEPTTHLDAPHQRALLRSLAARARAGGAVLAVLHDINLALLADRVVLMEAGRLRGDGAPADPALREAIVALFDHAFGIEPVDTRHGRRWVCVPTL